MSSNSPNEEMASSTRSHSSKFCHDQLPLSFGFDTMAMMVSASGEAAATATISTTTATLRQSKLEAFIRHAVQESKRKLKKRKASTASNSSCSSSTSSTSSDGPHHNNSNAKRRLVFLQPTASSSPQQQRCYPPSSTVVGTDHPATAMAVPSLLFHATQNKSSVTNPRVHGTQLKSKRKRTSWNGNGNDNDNEHEDNDDDDDDRMMVEDFSFLMAEHTDDLDNGMIQQSATKRHKILAWVPQRS